MYNYDLNTGEPIMGSPPSDNFISEQEVVQNANLMYDTNPQQRMMQQQMYQAPYYNNNPYYNTGYGYNQSGFGNYMNQPYQQPVYGAGFQGYVGNPAYAYVQQQNQYYNQYNQSLYGGAYGQPQQPQFRDYTYTVPGFNTGSTGLLPSNAEEICDRLQIEMQAEQEEAYVKRMQKQQSFYNSMGYGMNYYGMPYANQQYNDITITNKYRRMIDDMRQQAIDARTELNKNLSRLCQNYLYGEVDEDYIDDIYSAHTVTVTGAQLQEDYRTQELYQMVEIDPSIPYKQADAQASALYDKYFDKDTDMKTFFENIGQVVREERLEEEAHRRRDLSQLGDSNAYKVFMRRKIMERNNMQTENTGNGFTMPDITKNENIPMGSHFPTLNEAATMLDDGTISITAPPWLNSKTVVIKNEKENEYEMNERKFVQSIYGTDPIPGGGAPNG